MACAFVFFEDSDETSDVAPYVLHVSFLGHAHPVFDLSEALFHGIEFRGVGGRNQSRAPAALMAARMALDCGFPSCP